MSKSFKVILFILIPCLVLGQGRVFSVQGAILDKNIGQPLSDAIIIVLETQQKAISDENGKFIIHKLKPGNYHLGISHLGCKSYRTSIRLMSDTNINFTIEHYHEHIQEVKVKSTSKGISKSISEQTIIENSEKNLGNLLESTIGVRSLKTGNTIAKPTIQGLYGNRLSILNHGIAQSGQQWGNDHAPEIDPMSSTSIKVVKGVSALEYKAINMGALIILESEPITNDPHIHGQSTMHYESNGNGIGFNTLLEKTNKKVAWRFGTTVKRSGDRSTPNYYLKNTGAEELNFNLTLETKLWKNWNTRIIASSVNTKMGILRGASIGNLTDLQLAMNRETPLFTEENFSYSISPPRQSVNHFFLKLQSTKLLSDKRSIQLAYSSQVNLRREYDIRRGNRSETPVLDLSQFSNFMEAKYAIQHQSSYTKFGIQANYIENLNDKNTGVSPLIPNYSSIEPGIFLTHHIFLPKSQYQIGFRYDPMFQTVFTYDQVLRQQKSFSHQFHNMTFSGEYSHQFSPHTSFKFNSGFTARNPGINEMYSFGLHQGVSSIEEGNQDLKPELSFKTTAQFSTDWKEKIRFEILGYFHNINDYIYLKPADEYRLTVRGAFPVFKYDQTHAQIIGIDCNISTDISKQIQWDLGYNFISGYDRSQNLALIYIPSNSLQSSLKLNWAKFKKLENLRLELSGRYIAKQIDILPSQDFLVPPEAYTLFGLKCSAEQQLKKVRVKLFLKLENVLDSKYREYLNRQRYFADELGRNFVFGVHFNY
jgi:iron complex outermembrane receptor protein